jgi:hypothetical protein
VTPSNDLLGVRGGDLAGFDLSRLPTISLSATAPRFD